MLQVGSEDVLSVSTDTDVHWKDTSLATHLFRQKKKINKKISKRIFNKKSAYNGKTKLHTVRS